MKRERIMERLWESDEFIDDNTLTVNITRLRRKLEGIGITDFICTKKGIGYLLEMKKKTGLFYKIKIKIYGLVPCYIGNVLVCPVPV